MQRILIALLLCCAAVASQAQPSLGPWFDRARDGHGVDLQRGGDTLLIGLYTFAQDGEPEWFTAAGTPNAGLLDTELLRFRNAGTSEQPSVQSRVVGRLRWSTSDDELALACDDGIDRSGAADLAAMRFDIEGVEYLWCVEPLLPPSVSHETSMNGTWWGGGSDSGWGLTTYFIDSPGTKVAVQALYFYDADGEPRWSISQAAYEDFDISQRWNSPRGYCRSCPTQPLQARDGGSIELLLSTPLRSSGLGNRLTLQAEYAGPAAGGWQRDIELLRISDVVLAPDTLATREGLIVGREDRFGTRVWQGIPFAQPPLAELRWRLPQAPLARRTVRDAGEFGPACPQPPTQGAFPAEPLSQDEDCLSLNVWTPGVPTSEASPLPVMVWIHGGGHVQGGAAQFIGDRLVYDGSEFARRGVVLVSINYRLGALGYAVFREMIDEFPEQPGAGNYGLFDQIAALEWIAQNISQFGGDPNNVTIFGESAGGVSVCALLASPLAEAYFQRAITQSGPCTSAMPRLLQPNGNLEAAVDQGDRIKQRLGCSAADARSCLRSQPVQAVVDASNASIAFSGVGEPFAEVIDGFALPQSLRDAVRSGLAGRKDLMVGVNEDETNSLIPAAQRPASAAAYELLVRQRLGAIATLVLALYPAADYSPVWQAWTAINTDVAFVCPSARAARDHAGNGNRTYAYYFTQSLPGAEQLGAFHALEISFLFSDMGQYGESIQSLAETMKRLWIAFATDGIPAAPGVPTWPLHPADSQAGLELRADAIAQRFGYRDEFCDFWNRYIAL